MANALMLHTLLICTRNGSRTIRAALESIASQEKVDPSSFEVLVIDNGSNDSTCEVAVHAIAENNLCGRVLQESRPGKINAFLKGVREAAGTTISVVDDDNILDPMFLFWTLSVFKEHEDVAMVGSNNSLLWGGVYEAVPTWFEWTRGRYGCSSPMLSEIQRTDENGLVIAGMGIIAGAGSSFRKTPLIQCLDQGYEFFNDTQRGKGMKVTGEDTELCWLYRSLGLRFGYDPRIRVQHAVCPSRITLDNLYVLAATIGAGGPGFDPFMFTSAKSSATSWRDTWQWQFLSKCRQYVKAFVTSDKIGQSSDERRFRKKLELIQIRGSIRRIVSERNKYTSHIHRVACGEWSRLRVR